MNILNKAVDSIIPYANNPRNNKVAIDKVASSIKEFGFKVPIIIDKDNVIVTGHTRLMAAKKLGLESVPCIMADDLTPAQTTFAYEIGGFVVDKDGTLSSGDSTDSTASENLLAELTRCGFINERPEKLIIEMPRDGFTDASLANLFKLVESKSALKKRRSMLKT